MHQVMYIQDTIHIIKIPISYYIHHVMCIMYKQDISIFKSMRRNISKNNVYASGDVYTSNYTYYRKY